MQPSKKEKDEGSGTETGKELEVRAYLGVVERNNSSKDYKVLGIAHDPIELNDLVNSNQSVKDYKYLAYYVQGESIGSFENAMKYLGASYFGEKHGYWEYRGHELL